MLTMHSEAEWHAYLRTHCHWNPDTPSDATHRKALPAPPAKKQVPVVSWHSELRKRDVKIQQLEARIKTLESRPR